MTKVLVSRGDLLQRVLDPKYTLSLEDAPTPWVHGAPGWGKSVFAQQVVDRAQADGGFGLVVRFREGMDNAFIFLRDVLAVSEEFYLKNPKHESVPRWKEVQRHLLEECGPDYRSIPVPKVGGFVDFKVEGMWDYCWELGFRALAAAAGMVEASGFNRLVVAIDDVHFDSDAATAIEAAHERIRYTGGVSPVGVVFLTRPPFQPYSRYRYSPGPFLEVFSQAETTAWLAASFPDLCWSDAVGAELYGTARGVPWLTVELADQLVEVVTSGEPTVEQVQLVAAKVRSGLAEGFPALWQGLITSEKYYLKALSIHADQAEYAADRFVVERECRELIAHQKAPEEPFGANRQDEGWRNVKARGIVVYDRVANDATCLLPGFLEFVSRQVLPPYPPDDREWQFSTAGSADFYTGNRYP